MMIRQCKDCGNWKKYAVHPYNKSPVGWCNTHKIHCADCREVCSEYKPRERYGRSEKPTVRPLSMYHTRQIQEIMGVLREFCENRKGDCNGCPFTDRKNEEIHFFYSPDCYLTNGLASWADSIRRQEEEERDDP